ncbi:uncharacterized protein LACBIDRAFT_313746 [Laccaria bicolor S238N-H82]|uniref:Predicted protein n=1 Tax=Laccaria bicolor (strain S238N-H82 / ATCC MYA-4686) TaxID=486041 RepID=B0D0R0_LACBS|nr:uncharacterized protein LACBIDRAFT_313746 [Laccaria bicolor S238N-H82]EDR11864.1 predicted protein [Laccaria bicolor S238N-H82]|eukprot:XP_001877761.1 predicted protein [Laccaria bicolor S238N-H82]
MSFQGLISGSECAVPSNPLSQVLKHTEGDRSLQQLHQLPGTLNPTSNEHDVALARQFFDTNQQGHEMAPSFTIPYALGPARMDTMSGPHLHDAWVKEQQGIRPFEELANNAAWASEFGGSYSPSPSAQQIMVSKPEYQRPSLMSGVVMHGGTMPVTMYGANNVAHYGLSANFNVVEGKGKGKSREADFEAAFAQIAASLTPAQADVSGFVEIEDEATDIEESLKNVSLNVSESDVEHGTDFQKVWDQLQKSELPPPKEDLAKWEAEFSQLMNAQRDELDDYGSAMQEAWEGGVGNYQEGTHGENPVRFDAEGIPMLGDYVFEQNNKYLGQPPSSRSLLDDAKALLEQNGSLSEAAMMLEAAIQEGQLGEGGFETWILLGETRNMDEREDAGMRALTHGVKLAEEAGAPGAGMLSLAISFTNESYDRASHSMLLRWLRARFPTLVVPEETIKAMSTNSAWDTHTRITELFLGLARSQHDQGVMDPDVQIGLGVLFYTNGEYDRAKDCFATALAARPKDYLLWNRFGSSLSNGNKPEEALGAYREALQIRPTYTRAIYNVGVACLNIGADKEAAEHFLSALSLQQSTSGDTSDQLWFTLRRALLSMNRIDLADLAKPEARSSLELFRKEGFDF